MQYRQTKKGTLLVVILGLLVALFVIGTSFSFVTLSERRSAANYLDRQRALDIALDGVEYSVARLRAEATRQHYEGLTEDKPGVVGKKYDAKQYSLQDFGHEVPQVSWSRNDSATSTNDETPDTNWVDLNGNGKIDGNEQAWGTDKFTPNVKKSAGGFASTVTFFHADGVNTNYASNENVTRNEGDFYGAGGTYQEMGDYGRVRVIDAAALLNINNFKEDRLKEILAVLGGAIDDWITNGNPRGKYNPFPPTVVDEIVQLHTNVGYRIQDKEQLRPIYLGVPEGEKLYRLGMNFITVNSWTDTTYRDYADTNNDVPEKDNSLNLTADRFNREGFTSNTDGRDGWGDWQPEPSAFGRAPININTAPKPVLVCLFANLEARAKLLYFQRQNRITEEDVLIKSELGETVYRQNSGTTDLGRQNNQPGTPGSGTQYEDYWFPAGVDNRAIFQLVPIGPLTTAFGAGATSSNQQGKDYASALADKVIELRGQHAFTSWQDFDYRFCQSALLQLPQDRSAMTMPDLVGASRGGLSTGGANISPDTDLLPPADNCNHPANPLKDSNAAMSAVAFRAWYWKSVVDMIRAALNPNNVTSRYNADYPYHQNVDRMDLTTASNPICFSSMGVYEVVSQGDILPPLNEDDTTTSSDFNTEEREPLARRQVRTVVEIYQVRQHTSQKQMMKAMDPIDLNPSQTSSNPQKSQSWTALTRYNTKPHPFSIDELPIGIWEDNPPPEVNRDEDAEAPPFKEDSNNPNAGNTRRWKGYNPASAASDQFGWITLDPKDRTPVQETKKVNPLTFWARFNETFYARSGNQGADNPNVWGLNSEQAGLDAQYGHFPLETDAAFEDFISSATPRSAKDARDSSKNSTEFGNAHTGEEATKYASLMPDGVYLRGWHLRTGWKNAVKGSYGRRGSARLARLKILRYPCGSNQANNPFVPIRPVGNSMPDGIDDSIQQSSGTGQTTVLDRLIGNASTNFSGHDEHNQDREGYRQQRANMPYYEGTVDFWIKWELPPLGNEVDSEVAALGEIDPASHNFSGLFGATAFGRFTNPQNYMDPTSTNRNDTADFEGVQFMVYKEPGGVLRFSRLYFREAFGVAVQSGATGTGGGAAPVPFGNAERRNVDPADPWSAFTATGDICNSAANKGFLYSRTDAWIDLNKDPAVAARRVMLRPHDWHRFTLSYNSNTDQPYRLWIDGKFMSNVMFVPDPDGTRGFRNDGSHNPFKGQDPRTQSTNSDREVDFYRNTCKLMEINPEDRLTIGCVFRRQLDIMNQTVFDEYYDEQNNVDSSSNVGGINMERRPSRPLFKFDSNFVAVANATIDDFRIGSQVRTNGSDLSPSEMAAASRYDPVPDSYYENGFLPMNDDGALLALPVRLGTITWTEYRPDWDPFENKGIDLQTSSRIEMHWAVFDDVEGLDVGGKQHDFSSATESGYSGDRNAKDIESDMYWANGGMSLNGVVLPAGDRVGVLLYRAYFRGADGVQVQNMSVHLDDIKVTVLTPPRKLSFIIDF